MKILITAPSLDESENVSGIATIVRSIISHGAAQYVHFTAGRKDADRFDARWIAAQAALPFRFLWTFERGRFDVVHINTSFEPRSIVRDLALAAIAKNRGVPVLLHIHGGRYLLGELPDTWIRKAAGYLVRQATAVVVLSSEERERLLVRFPGPPVFALPNSIEVPEMPADSRAGRDERTVLYLGRLHESKGLADIVSACAVLAGQGFVFRFECCGTGPEKDNFVTEMKTVLGGKFHYNGVAGRKEKWAAFASADIFLLPSRFEGLPMALLEAMAAGCVPVASSVGMIPEVIDDGRNGFLIEYGNLTQIVGKLKMLLSESGPALDELRKNARNTVAEKFDIKSYISKLDAIYAAVQK